VKSNWNGRRDAAVDSSVLEPLAVLELWLAGHPHAESEAGFVPVVLLEVLGNLKSLPKSALAQWVMAAEPSHAAL
jgi:hypothetical protein